MKGGLQSIEHREGKGKGGKGEYGKEKSMTKEGKIGKVTDEKEGQREGKGYKTLCSIPLIQKLLSDVIL